MVQSAIDNGFPVIDRNPQKFVPSIYKAQADDFVPATQRVYSTPGMESFVGAAGDAVTRNAQDRGPTDNRVAKGGGRICPGTKRLRGGQIVIYVVLVFCLQLRFLLHGSEG